MWKLKGHRDGCAIRSLSFAPDGTALASWADDQTVRLWNLATGTGRVVAEDGRGNVQFSPDGRWLAWGAPYGLSVWDLQADAPPRPLPFAEGPPSDFQFAPDSRPLAVAHTRIRLLDVGTWSPRVTWDDCGEAIFRLAVAADGRWLASAHLLPGSPHNHRRYMVRVSDLATGRPFHDFRDPTNGVRSLCLSSDGRLVAYTFGSTYVVQPLAEGVAGTGHKIMHREFFTCAFTPDARFLAVSRSDLTVRFLDTRTWRERAAFRWGVGRVHCLTFDRAGMKAAGGGHKGAIVIWDVDL